MVRLLETPGVMVKDFNFIADIRHSIWSGSFTSSIWGTPAAALGVKESESITGSQSVGWLFYLE